jgi:hypothetical protein
MLDRIIKSFSSIPEHLIALGMIVIGSIIAIIPHVPHAYDTGTALAASGLTMYKGRPPAE